MRHNDPELPENEEPEEKSRTQIKNEMKALQDLGAELVVLNDEQLAKLPLTDKLIAAVHESRNIKQHIARKRHLKYVGKLLREVDEEAIRKGLDVLRSQDTQANARFHKLEQWRDRMLEEGDRALGEFLNDYPQADRQQLRQLIRNAKKEQTANKPPKSARALFKELRAIVESAA
ncbi:MAG: DUF615 domain-containing protein [Gammaproteobacteria bacterium]|nr:DUF615 domain-containing protein [Gammaproteobacteria bacterium]